MPSIKIGISACLLGEKVRYDGGHKHDRYITETLGRYFQFVPVCPETECGLGIPREAMRLVGDPNTPRLVTNKTFQDKTAQMQRWTAEKLEELAREDLCGFIFKKGSPSSGLYRVKIYNETGNPVHSGRGIFAAAFTARFSRIPVEEEGRLQDPGLRENFIEQVFTLKRWRESIGAGRSVGDLIDFHTREKLLILSHSTTEYQTMGRLVARGKHMNVDALYDEYEELLVKALYKQATTAKHTNVLSHIQGYFKKHLSSDEKQEMLELITNYRQGLIPLVVPVTLLAHYVRKFQQPYLQNQTYLHPHPLDLRLRNHV
jgi:uncharacterized protein YbgA (DUF1722 family)/uncharacterized protein YbbK (DUF523 family)